MDKVKTLLKDMTFNSRYRMLDYGKDRDEMSEVAKKRGVKLPAHDLSIFKCTYAYVNRSNLNGCTLPREEVEKSLETLNDKAIDFDHIRARVVGHWIDAKLEGDEIVAYGIFYKGNFGEDYEVIRELMDKNVLAVSFEAYGNRIGNQTGGYDLTDIEFAGGALLIKTKPAFPGSEVTEIAKRRERVLEMASVMTEPKEYIHTSEKKKSIDTAKKKGTDNLDNNLGGRKSMTIEELKKKVESLEGEKASLETQLKEKDQAIAKKDESLDKKSEKLEKVQATVEELKKESEEVKAKIEDVEQAKEKEISKAKEDAKVVATRRAELDSFAKDLSDEDLLNDAKYELAKANQKLAAKEKEIEELKNSGSDEDMSKGSRKTKKKDGDPVELSAKKVDEYTRW